MQAYVYAGACLYMHVYAGETFWTGSDFFRRRCICRCMCTCIFTCLCICGSKCPVAFAVGASELRQGWNCHTCSWLLRTQSILDGKASQNRQTIAVAEGWLRRRYWLRPRDMVTATPTRLDCCACISGYTSRDYKGVPSPAIKRGFHLPR